MADLAALHETLDAAGSACLAAMNGDQDHAAAALLEASMAAALAFQPGTAGAQALDTLIGAIADESRRPQQGAPA